MIAFGVRALVLVVVVACSGPAPTDAPSQPPPSAGSPSVAATPTELATTATPSPHPTATPGVTPKAPHTGHKITVFAGGGREAVAPGMKGTDAALKRPTGVAVGSTGGPVSLPLAYIVDADLGLEFQVDIATDRIGNTVTGFIGAEGVAAVNEGLGPTVPWIADASSNRVVNGNNERGSPVVIAGDPDHASYRGDGGPARRAWLSGPFDVAWPYIADTSNERIRYVDRKGTISTVAGNGIEGYDGDEGPAAQAELANPQAIAISADRRTLYIADTDNFRIRAVDVALTGTIATVAGTGDAGLVPFNANLRANETPVADASALTADSLGNIYFPVVWSDLGRTIMRMSPDGSMTLIAGGGRSSTADVDATDFALAGVLGLAIDREDGSLFICAADGNVYSVAGVAQPD